MPINPVSNSSRINAPAPKSEQTQSTATNKVVSLQQKIDQNSAWNAQKTKTLMERTIPLPVTSNIPPPKPAYSFPEPAYRPQAPFAWLQKFQSLLDNAKDLNWIQSVEKHALANTLPDPTPHLAKFASTVPAYQVKGQPCPTLQKIVGWLMYMEDMLELNSVPSKVKYIQDLQLGSVLSQCAQILNSVPVDQVGELMPEIAGQINLRSAQILSVLSEYYFLESDTWEGRVEPPTGDISEIPDVATWKRMIRAYFKRDVNRTLVTAWDSAQNRFLTSISGRMFEVTGAREIFWKYFQDECKTKFSSTSAPFCSSLTIEKITMQFLLSVGVHFTQMSLVRNTDTLIINLIFSRLSHSLIRLISEKTDPSSRMELFTQFCYLFEEMLPLSHWQQLFNLFRKGNLTNAFALLMNERRTNVQLLMMNFARVSCGEVKIVLDCCRMTGKLSLEERNKLPQTLKERLHFSSIRSVHHETHSTRNNAVTGRIQGQGKIGEHEFNYLNLCSKCTERWPVFEALYWTILKSGLDISATEALERLIQTAHNSKK